MPLCWHRKNVTESISVPQLHVGAELDLPNLGPTTPVKVDNFEIKILGVADKQTWFSPLMLFSNICFIYIIRIYIL